MRVSYIETRWVEVDRKARKRIQNCEEQRLCVACMQPLGSGRVIRGCHEKCYRATLRLIAKGKTTEQSRLEAGKLLEGCRPGRKPSNPVTVEVTG